MCPDCQRKTHRSEEEKAALTSRINRIIGQLNGIKKMIDEDKYCNDILIQLSAVTSSTKSLSFKILERHMETCVANDIRKGDDSSIEETVDILKRFL